MALIAQVILTTGDNIGEFMKQKKSPKSTLLADNTLGLITTKQTKPKSVASAALHPITPGMVKKEISMNEDYWRKGMG